MQEQPLPQPFGEIIESSLHTFIVKSWEWDTVAPFGSLVIGADSLKKVYGLVYNVKTTSFDPTGMTITYQKDAQALKEEYPHVFEFLETTSTVLILGYQLINETHIRYQYPTTPITLYSFVSYANKEAMLTFFKENSYINMLTKQTQPIECIDELLYTLISLQKSLGIFSEENCISLLTEYTTTQQLSYNQLRHMLHKVEQL